MLNALRFVMLMSTVVWVGMIIFFSMVVTPVIFKTLPRATAGELVGNLFPRYWAIGYVAGILSLSSLLAISFVEKGFPAARILILALMTALTFYSGLVISPQAKAVKAQMAVVEDPAKAEELKAEFGRIHKKSFALNIVVLLAGVVFIFFIARNMRL
ncbi:MAG TPA: DUF4149 domain-containing protein [Deltaproteobacteria bacterium]|nr:MAG: hypothetical protein A2Z79_02905 [Deltaproteobacteria bacterium GWA2_55_82]OGQ64306.1 MAG: hypothetical protein A3I81_04235 [Deltaproteobacteria bacterium RIFCSPLOWO2_02_FULL_55_12]OIJ74349.1 MAG: hypothetical protein A2V21_308805 [Deltaproteobacteria bacterium GWC2_55_46]HBG46991.1 DUF4149 domain-containing protein [Deltaproteobacteria bacterium]HCY10949.1 DUF4149 domain-containing protein [Deltaproteobacteria bacterium]